MNHEIGVVQKKKNKWGLSLSKSGNAELKQAKQSFDCICRPSEACNMPMDTLNLRGNVWDEHA